jgi:hypothetical protein
MYSQELAMCQRYYQEITKTAAYDNVTNASVWQTTNAFGVFTWLPMRASPTLTATFTDFVVRSGGTAYNATGGSFANIRPDRCQFNLSVIKRIEDGACIPIDEANTDYQEFLSNGNLKVTN